MKGHVMLKRCYSRQMQYLEIAQETLIATKNLNFSKNEVRPQNHSQKHHCSVSPITISPFSNQPLSCALSIHRTLSVALFTLHQSHFSSTGAM